MNSFLLYLLEVAFCQLIFCLLYLAAFRNLSFFQINRFFLLLATLVSFIIPMLSIPFWNAADTVQNLSLIQNLQNIKSTVTSTSEVTSTKTFFNMGWVISSVLIVYFIGFLISLFKLIGGINTVLKLVKNNEVKDYDGIKTIHTSYGPSFFVFLNYVFINTHKMNLSSEEFQQVINHEHSHIIQKHTLDNLFMELALVICWFNPFLRIMKKELNNVHEFYADQQAMDFKADISTYSSLILKLSTDQHESRPFLSHQFSMNHIKQRIIMLNKEKKSVKITLRYFAIIPCLTLLLVMFSFSKKDSKDSQNVFQNDLSQIISNINWEGNTLYSDSYLTAFTGLKIGEKFNEEKINSILSYRTDGSDLASLYMDKGYLFFTVEMKKILKNGNIDLTFDIFEGQVMTVGKITVVGNQEIKTDEILKMIELKEGDLFSRSKLIASQKNIIASTFFEPEKVIPTPIPNPEDGTVAIEFKVAEN